MLKENGRIKCLWQCFVTVSQGYNTVIINCIAIFQIVLSLYLASRQTINVMVNQKVYRKNTIRGAKLMDVSQISMPLLT